MKTLSIIFIFFGICLFCAEVSATEWAYFGTDNFRNDRFYDKETLRKLPNGIIRAWEKMIYSDEGRNMYILRRISKGSDVKAYEALGYSLDLWEIDCIKMESRLMATYDHPTHGVALQSYTYHYQPSEGWDPIIPDSMGHAMYKTVCPPKKH